MVCHATHAAPKGLKSATVSQSSEIADAWPTSRVGDADLTLSESGSRKASAQALFAKGLLAEESGDADAALEAFREALLIDPGYGELAVKVAFELTTRRNEVSEGIQVLKDVIKASPSDPVPMVYLAQIYAKELRKPDLALKYAEAAVEASPANFKGHAAVFDIHFAAGDIEKAERSLERARKMAPSDGMYWKQIGDLYTRLFLKDDGQTTPEALQKMNGVFRKAAEWGANDCAVQAGVGDYFVLSRQVVDAIPFYELSLSLPLTADSPPRRNVREKLAHAYKTVRRIEDAIATFEQLDREAPDRQETYEQLAELYESIRDFPKAMRQLENCIRLDPANPSNYVRLTELQLRSKEPDRAIDTMRKVRQRFRNEPRITYALARTLVAARRPLEALPVFAEAKAEAQAFNDDILDADFYFQYGATAEQAGMIEIAAEMLQRAISLEPASAAPAYNYLGYMWVDRGVNLDKAGEMIRKALQIDPDNGAYLDSLGWFYHKKGDHEAALRELLRSLEVAAGRSTDDDPVVFDHIADVYLALGKIPDALQYWQRALPMAKEDMKLSESINGKIESAKQKMATRPGVPNP